MFRPSLVDGDVRNTFSLLESDFGAVLAVEKSREFDEPIMLLSALFFVGILLGAEKMLLLAAEDNDEELAAAERDEKLRPEPDDVAPEIAVAAAT
jgi:hypothetical protein